MGILLSGEKAARLEYLWWAAKRCLGANEQCPACGGGSARLIRRKYLVTSLYECPSCHLRFRVPKETAEGSEFYADETYQQGFTTTLPNHEELQQLVQTRFAGTEKDYARYIVVLRRFLPPGATIVDFGCSWGYGSWQMREAGFNVISYEIGRRRAQYARERLACTMVDDLRSLDGAIDCFFSAHVIEHLPDPAITYREAAHLLRPGGLFVCFCPNGNPERERIDDKYDHVWGKVHPTYITPSFMRWACAVHGLVLAELNAGENLLGVELTTVAKKQ